MEKAKIITNGNVNLENIEVKPSLNKASKIRVKNFIEWVTINYIIEGCDEFVTCAGQKSFTFNQVWKEYVGDK